MKKDSINKIRLGAFVFAGVLLFAAGIYFIGAKQQLFSRTFRITAIFNNVSGLQVGNNVRFSGINVGTIQHVQIISDTAVQVEMLIEEDTRPFIKKDAVAVIGSDGLMGNKILNILPGTIDQPSVENDDRIGTIQPANFDEIMEKLKLVADHTAEMTGDLAAITANIRSGKGTIGKLFMDTVFADNLDQTLVNIRHGTKGFQQNMEAAKSNFLLRGYFRKKEKQKEQEKKEKEENRSGGKKK